MNERPTLIEFVDKYTREFASHVFLREKVDGTWTETTFDQTRKEGLRIAAGLMSMGIRKGEGTRCPSSPKDAICGSSPNWASCMPEA